MALITSDWSLDAWIFISAVLLGLYLYFRRNLDYWKKRGVKYVEPTLFFGNTVPCLLARKTPDVLIREIYEKGAGEQFIGFHVFNKPYLVVRDPELIKNVFIKDFNNFTNKVLCGNHTDVMSSTNLFVASNPPWKSIRTKLSPIFTSGKLRKMYELMEEICDDLQVYLDKLDIDEKVGKPIEIKEICAKFTTDLIGTTAFGMRLNSLTDPNAEFRKNGRRVFRSSFKRYLQLLALFFIPPLRPYTNAKFFDEKATDFLRTEFWNVINERIKSGFKRDDLLDMLIEIKNNQDNGTDNTFRLEGDALVAQAAIFFTGGFETSSTTMSFALYELARNPESQTKLRNEILNALETTGGKVTYEMMTTLPYLHMVTLEALRLYPVIAWLDRIPETDYTFPGTNVTVEKGVPVVLPLRALQLSPQYFPNPNQWDPERFSEENKKNIVPFTYFPFGEGPRSCIGIRLGYIQTKLGILNFISKYELTVSKESANLQPEPLNIITQAKGGIYLNLRKLTA
ncbi:cytochrome P450 6AQ4 [Nasonia vitripennis]|uniref:Cytochrome P450 n=1 Tax=Nasonia vitripennis TaxID=7425 RepID=A0A7M6UDP0_NASVI|nr:cytochrome P450 6AQ4 [Nasonia vitripennis]